MSATGRIFGVPITLLDMQGTLELCAGLIEQRRPVQHVVLNASKVVMMHDDPRLKAIIEGCDVVNADGQSIVWAGRLLGVPVPERVAGIDLMGLLLERCAAEGWPVYFLGARPDVLDDFVRVALSRLPDLRVAGFRDGYFSQDEEAEVAADIARSGARVVFVATPSPMKEYFLARNLERMGPVFAMGVGGSFDVWAGRTARAPKWMQKAGLEWLYRFMQEPRRMWRRYLVGNARFAGIVARERFRPR